MLVASVCCFGYYTVTKTNLCKLGVTFMHLQFLIFMKKIKPGIKPRRIRSVVRALYCNGGCLGFVFWGRTKIVVLK